MTNLMSNDSQARYLDAKVDLLRPVTVQMAYYRESEWGPLDFQESLVHAGPELTEVPAAKAELLEPKTMKKKVSISLLCCSQNNHMCRQCTVVSSYGLFSVLVVDREHFGCCICLPTTVDTQMYAPDHKKPPDQVGH